MADVVMKLEEEVAGEDAEEAVEEEAAAAIGAAVVEDDVGSLCDLRVEAGDGPTSSFFRLWLIGWTSHESGRKGSLRGIFL